jgi:L-glutamine-phosphate cytidylyltransferase
VAAPLDDAETLRLHDGSIAEIGRRPADLSAIDGQYLGVTRFSPDGLAAAGELRSRRREQGAWSERMQMTELLQALVDDGVPVKAIEVEHGWLEVDTPADLTLYRQVVGGEALPGWIRWPPHA